MTRLQKLTPEDIKQAYEGTPGCMCGCNGEYFESDLYPGEVIRILRTIQSQESNPTLDIPDDFFYAHVTIDGKVFCVYPTKNAMNTLKDD